MLEVELKFKVNDGPGLRERLARVGFAEEEAESQVDCYFAHPCRDFVRTDEALRLRQIGDRHYITYKGPKLDTVTKTRREIELELAADSGGGDWTQLLEALGFRPVALVRKRRQEGTVIWQGRGVTVALDTVEGLGDFVELEVVTDERELDTARACIQSLAAQLGLEQSERRGYLDMLQNP